MRSFPLRPALTMVLFALLLALAGRWIGGVSGPSPRLVASLLDYGPRRPIELPVSHLKEHKPRAENVCLRVPEGALDHFYAALWRTEKDEPGAITRIVHFGDSPATADLITGDVRALLQQRLGDAGHGFTLIGRPWAWYGHRGVSLSASGWRMMPATEPHLKDGACGLGGVAFDSSGEASSRITLEDPSYSRIEVWYQTQPGGGSLEVWRDSALLGRIDTAGPASEPGFAAFPAPPGGPITLRASGNVRVFGVVFERSSPGVVYDSLGLNGAFTTILARLIPERHLAEELRHRHPDLVILNYGTNESGFASYVSSIYEGELRAAIRRLRAAVPDASLLIMSPMDRAQRVAGGDIQTLASIPRLVAIQERVARDTGCAFYNTYAAMGGSGTMRRWYEASPRLVSADFIHATPAGARTVGETFSRALLDEFARYKIRQMRALLTCAR